MNRTRSAAKVLLAALSVGLAACAASESSRVNKQTSGQESHNQARDIAHATRHDVLAMLDAFHAAAARADGAAYFSLYAPEAVFIGTDAGERWTMEEFKAYAEPYFSKGKGWTYVPRAGSRHVTPVSGTDGRIAFFKELLDNDKYGTCRGTGVARVEGGAWRIVQYHLTFPVPNDLAERITGEIKAWERGTR
ncbi:MAG: nuclear transport factor 2 family protein [Phycisphaeraceae bacterium]|nr:nuclear transport factor 2 family protein [Phycisphaeraceae bacterium]